VNNWQKKLLNDLSFLRWDPNRHIKKVSNECESCLKFNRGVHLNSSELSIAWRLIARILTGDGASGKSLPPGVGFERGWEKERQ
jgi:hypothetical protein